MLNAYENYAQNKINRLEKWLKLDGKIESQRLDIEVADKLESIIYLYMKLLRRNTRNWLGKWRKMVRKMVIN